jgi:lactate permease
MLLLWVSPILAFMALSAARLVPALWAAALSLGLAACIVLFGGPVPTTAYDVAGMLIGGAWIALPAVLVILAGLYFTEVLEAASPKPAPDTAKQAVSARDLGTICLFIGPFVETATGFGVGYVVAVSAVLRAGIGPAGALGLGAFSQCLVPWGALGIGTKISASIASVPVDDLTWRIAILIAPVLSIMLLVYWRIAQASGVEINSAQRREDTITVTALAGLLIGTNFILPIELAGLTAIAPVLLYRQWRSHGNAVFRRPALRRAAPYAILLALLAVTKLIPSVRDFLSAHAYTPGSGAPLFAPFASPALALLLAAVLGCLSHGHWRGLQSGIAPTFQKGVRASVLTILLVALAWVIVRSGIAEAFAQALTQGLGSNAALVVPALGGLGGYLTGSNTGAGSLAMPVAQSITQTPLALLWIAGAAIMAGSVFTAFSPVRFAMGQAIAQTDSAATKLALRWLLPFGAGTLLIAIGTAFIVGRFYI